MSASDTLTVLAPGSIAPTLSKTFLPANINVGNNSLLTITLGNTNGTAASFASFTDTLPIGVTFVGSATNNGCGGSLSTIGDTVTLTGGSIPANGSCTVTATVTSLVPGLHLNTTGSLVTDKGTAPPASDTLIVNEIIDIIIGKSFTPGTIVAGGVSLLTITVTNQNLSIATPVAFTDFLPSSPGPMLVASGPQTNTCNGTLTATTGSSSVTLAGGLLPAGPSSCTVTVYVTAATLGNYTNLLGTASAILQVLPVIPSPLAGETPYIAIVGNDAITGIGLGNGVANPFYFSQKHQQFLNDQDLISVPVCWGQNPIVTPQTRIGGLGCEQFRSNKPIDQPEICDSNGTVIEGAGNDPDTFTFFGEPNAVIPKQNAGYFEWWVRLPKKPSGEINLCIQCGVLKPNTFAFEQFDAIDLCAAETGERIGTGFCARDQVEPGYNPIVNAALPKITAEAYPGPNSLGFKPFNLTAYKNPGKYDLTLERVPNTTDLLRMSNSTSLQVLDGTVNTRVLLKACMDKCIVVKIPVTDQMNAKGQVEADLEPGDLIRVKMDVPIQNTVDIYCHSQSLKVMGIGE